MLPDSLIKEARALNLTPAQFAAFMDIRLPGGGLPPAGDAPWETALPPSISQKQGQCTLQDYASLPTGLRAQMIDGYIITQGPVQPAHQAIIAELMYQLTVYIKETGSACKAITSPVRLYLPGSHTTVLAPDIALILHPGRITGQRATALPEFAAEVLSPESRCLDCIKKLDKYRDWGIKEYWIIDGQTQAVHCYQFAPKGGVIQKDHSFSDAIPVHTQKGLYLDFRKI